MSELKRISLLEAEAILLAELKSPKTEIDSTIREMMTATKIFLAETNSYFDELRLSETLPSRIN